MLLVVRRTLSVGVSFNLAENLQVRKEALSQQSHLTHCILVDSSTVICWTSSIVILGVSGSIL